MTISSSICRSALRSLNMRVLSISSDLRAVKTPVWRHWGQLQSFLIPEKSAILLFSGRNQAGTGIICFLTICALQYNIFSSYCLRRKLHFIRKYENREEYQNLAWERWPLSLIFPQFKSIGVFVMSNFKRITILCYFFGDAPHNHSNRKHRWLQKSTKINHSHK